MLDIFQQIIDASRQPGMLHAMMVHLPLAIGTLGPGLVLWLIGTGGRSEAVRWLVVTLFALGVVVSVMAMQSGEAAFEQAQVGGSVARAVNEHEEMGEKVWIFMAGCAALTSLSVISWRYVRWGALILALLLSLVTLIWVAITGHLGGMLVYTHGVGMPR